MPLSAAEIAAAAANAAIAAASSGKDSGPARQARRLYIGNIPHGTADVKFCLWLSFLEGFVDLISLSVSLSPSPIMSLGAIAILFQ